MAEKKIIWLASYPKSGNTWMRAFLWRYHLGHDGFVNLNQIYKFIPSLSSIQLYIDANDGIEPHDDEYGQLREKVLRKMMDKQKRGAFLILKNHNARVFHCKHEVVPQELTKKAVYIVRNPLDVVDSLAQHTGMSLDRAVEFICSSSASLGGAGTRGGLEVLASWSDHVTSWAYGEQTYPTLIVRYEDLLSIPALYFGNVVSFLGWQVFEDRVEQSIRCSAFEKLRAFEDAHGFVENPSGREERFFRRGEAGTWRGVLSGDQMAKIIRCNSRVMKRFGYLDQNFEPL
ncbi:sulfotransferase domain-containing protein [Lamprobacter modestohalophilus]|uniref:sulfotransferase domain-containing protein n=1 Tax=Lamprobacter modestohalophilus TaxID=1064514 RepID=UPI002ADEEE9E|nr:sulfotransferase domain-containing protein [Lamprobacter modestohalophilus]MEA1051739.1 sulfotransferase domain-containing protein [Lamprobacter modestohalophilus]